jgi:hypothetical protein
MPNGCGAICKDKISANRMKVNITSKYTRRHLKKE